ncbi:hypothetical protein TRV_01303 [Trichophyton verrucosum HKI 0517]|uniref:Uncharacterized protein n=1 Tax=Trichophyton verrucosum (strain HKI 0517) TaxID=663202 RepID=D4D2J8_TRIVH|nr:uncharacterized protein TRV_01303 [Trichophyton verrucosum HKI 0517]EFE43924.1 hypothetical protein TRV_01303 [Trichophyton verrucosum HKI 0517]
MTNHRLTSASQAGMHLAWHPWPNLGNFACVFLAKKRRDEGERQEEAKKKAKRGKSKERPARQKRERERETTGSTSSSKKASRQAGKQASKQAAEEKKESCLASPYLFKCLGRPPSLPPSRRSCRCLVLPFLPNRRPQRLL